MFLGFIVGNIFPVFWFTLDQYLALSDEAGSGYLRTERIGKYIIINDLITGDLNKVSVKKDLSEIYNIWGYDFGGIFMKNDPEQIPEYLMEKIILRLGKSDYSIFYYDSEKRGLELLQDGSLKDI